MTQLTRKWIEWLKHGIANDKFIAVCDLALKGLEAERLEKDRDTLLLALRIIAGLGKESLTVDRDGVFSHQKIARAAIAAEAM